MSAPRFDRWRSSGGFGSDQPCSPTSAYRVQDYTRMPAVNSRMHKLWRPDNRYPGYVSVRRHESGGVELSFDALRHGARPRPPIVVAADQVDWLILSLLQVRNGPWGEIEESGTVRDG